VELQEADHRQAIVANPADASALQAIAILALQAGDGLRAMRQFWRAFLIHDDKAVFDQQASAAIDILLEQLLVGTQTEDVDDAVAQLEWLSELVPISSSFARVLGAFRLIQGRDEEAAQLRPFIPPEESDGSFVRALEALQTYRQERDFLGSVVIPAHNAQATIERALDSVMACIAHYREETGEAEAKVHISIVDDGSKDDTLATIRGWSARYPEQSLALTVHGIGRGAGAARNAGAAAAKGPLLWFLDADDYFLEHHFLVTARVLRDHPDAAFVRTGMMFDRIDDQVTPGWRAASEGSYPCNLCIRREAHEKTGGFPDEPPFCPAMAEDVGYSRVIQARFPGLTTPSKTVFYSMSPGNVLDKMREEMTSTPGVSTDPGRDIPPRFRAAEILMRRRIYAVRREAALAQEQTELARLCASLVDDAAGETPPVIELARMWLDRGQHGRAVPLLQAAIAVRPTDARLHLALAQALVRDLRFWEAMSALHAAADVPGVAQAWFDLGVAAHREGRRDAAIEAFRNAASLQPDLVSAQYNVGALLMAAGDIDAAVPSLQAALDRQPDHVNALHQLGLALRRRGDPERALSHLSKASLLAPERGDIAAEASDILLMLGRIDEAAAEAERAVSIAPTLYQAHAVGAKALEANGRDDDALASWERAIACNPGFGEAFSRRTLLLLKRRWGPACAPRPQAEQGRRVSASRLGLDGRFGNQLLQYGFLRLYAERHGLTLETPEWLGRHLFDLDDPLPGAPLPAIDEQRIDLAADRTGRFAEHDIHGYFCGDVSGWAGEQERFRTLFRPGLHAAPIMNDALAQVRHAGRTLVAIHLRRGDYGWGPFWIAPTTWYLDWLSRIWSDLDEPVLFIATDDPDTAEAFRTYRPIIGRDLQAAPEGIEFLPDFHILSQADIIATSNSTFSGVAALINPAVGACFRPDRNTGALRPFAPWNAPILL
jgi:tetratricopeptide (TPR) repeat protein